MSFYRWKYRSLDKLRAISLAEELGLDEFLALIAVSRGYLEPESLEEFLSDDYFSYDYLDLADIRAAADKINQEVLLGTKITIYGDYDCDGITSTALLYKVLKSINANVDYYIPSRQEEGYGINKESIKNIYNNGTRLIITVDNGISAIEEIEYANSLGITVIVTDHHLPGEKLPNAYAVIDPKRKDDIYPFKELAGVGVAFYLAAAILNNPAEELLEEYSYLVAIGTVADVCPLVYDNRVFVKSGIKTITEGKSLALKLLIESAGANSFAVNTGTLSFTAAPRLNSAGRIDTALIALKLLLTEDKNEIIEITKTLNFLNAKRQEIEAEIIKAAKQEILDNKYNYDKVIVAVGKDWHEGVVGIAAAKLCEQFSKPVILLNQKGEISSGSCRSLGDFSIYEALASQKDLLLKYGGHNMAAGLTINTKDIDLFRKNINLYAEKSDEVAHELLIDCRLNPKVIDCDFIDSLSIFEPFGAGNPTPIFALNNMVVEEIEGLSLGKHTKITVSRDGAYYKLLYFSHSLSLFPLSLGDVVDVAVSLSVNEWQGRRTASIIVKDIRLSGLNEEEYLKDSSLFDRYMKNNITDIEAKSLLPSREECALVFKAVEQNTPIEKIFNKVNTLKNSKIKIAVSALIEIGVLDKNNEGLLNRTGNKANLANSNILKQLQKEE